MDIIVEGNAIKNYKPEEVNLDLTFQTKRQSYQEALEEGSRDVQIFLQEVFDKLGFSRDELKTESFTITKERRFIDTEKRYVDDGFNYKQTSFLKFDYDVNRMTQLMEQISSLGNPPRYEISFAVKNEDQVKNEVLGEAYAKAQSKAKAIATAAGKNLTSCVKVSFKPFDNEIVSNSGLNDIAMSKITSSRGSASVADIIKETFTPEDVKISEKLYCMWITD